MTARELFEAAWGAPDRLRQIEREIGMTAPERGGSSAIVGRSSGIGDPTARAALGNAQRLDALARERATLTAALDECRQVLAGMRQGLGDAHADVVEWRFLDGDDMFYVADELGVSMSTAYRMMATALEWVDLTGIVVVKGMGRA